jgi:ribosomal protein L12E/L44/L45/RPP1/RPP2
MMRSSEYSNGSSKARNSLKQNNSSTLENNTRMATVICGRRQAHIAVKQSTYDIPVLTQDGDVQQLEGVHLDEHFARARIATSIAAASATTATSTATTTATSSTAAVAATVAATAKDDLLAQQRKVRIVRHERQHDEIGVETCSRQHTSINVVANTKRKSENNEIPWSSAFTILIQSSTRW